MAGETGALAVVQEEREQQVQQWTPRFVLTIDQAVELVEQKRQFLEQVMKEGQHYGRIPGMPKDAKPALFKSGAELLTAAMSLHPVLTDAEPPMRDFDGKRHGGVSFWGFRRVCRIYRQTGPAEDERMLIAQAEGSCNSFEVKYRYRVQQRVCPECGAAAIRQAKPKDGKDGGFYCWRKLGGCEANFHHDEPRILEQKLGRIENPDIFDMENTGLKMADKRALVAATLIATGCSDLFTQDIEDRAEDGQPDEEPNGAPQRQAAPVSGALTVDQRADIEALANSLPKPVAPVALEAMLKAGYAAARTALRNKHQEQCCNDNPECSCDHVAISKRHEEPGG